MAPSLGRLFLSIPWLILPATLSRTPSGSAKSLSIGEVLDLDDTEAAGGVSSHCLCIYMVPKGFIFRAELTIGCTQCM